MSGSRAFLPHANDGGVAASIDPELAQALLLVRVSTMKMLRLQLAIERRDRAVALQAVDDLVELDEWIAGYANRMANDVLFEAIAREVDDERRALLQEKFGLAAGLIKREAEPGPRPWVEPEAAEVEPEPAETPKGPLQRGHAHADEPYDFLGTPFYIPDEKEPVRRWRWLLIVAMLVVLLAAAAGAALMLGWVPDDLPDQLLSQGGLR